MLLPFSMYSCSVNCAMMTKIMEVKTSLTNGNSKFATGWITYCCQSSKRPWFLHDGWIIRHHLTECTLVIMQSHCNWLVLTAKFWQWEMVSMVTWLKLLLLCKPLASWGGVHVAVPCMRKQFIYLSQWWYCIALCEWTRQLVCYWFDSNCISVYTYGVFGSLLSEQRHMNRFVISMSFSW